MKTNFLLGWNDEYLDMRMVAGPFSDGEKEKVIREEVVNMLMKIYKVDEKEANNIVENEDKYPEIDLNVYGNGASLIYGCDYEERIQVVSYDLEQTIEVNTPAGKIFSKVMPDNEYPGIATLMDYPGEPGIIMEYDPNKEHIVSRVYSAEDPKGDPCEVISFKNDK